MAKIIYLAGGCFWGIEAYFMQVKGIINTTAGYANGNCENPIYQQVCTGKTDFAEAVKIVYDENLISLKEILKRFFDIINPTSLNRQGNDIGTQYRTWIYYINDKDLSVINDVINEEQNKYNAPIVTEVKKLENFYEAEEYHQKYLQKNPSGYCHINLSKAKTFKMD